MTMLRKREEAYVQRSEDNGATFHRSPQMSGVHGQTYTTAINGVAGTVANPVSVHVKPTVAERKKSLLDAYLLWLVLGLTGAHHFYLKRPGFGVLYLFTFGLCGCGYVIDMFRMPYLVKMANKKREDRSTETKKNMSDAYTLWFPFGLLGFHHFYLNNTGFGVLYVFTFGLFGIGWLVDLFRMPSMIRESNSRTKEQMVKHIGMAYALGIFPLGIFGSHHFYLNRPLWGLLYLISFGMFGLGWIIDWFRIPLLVKRVNKHLTQGDDGSKYLDDAYILWIPFLGLLGGHHFYLNRPYWGILYFFTFGLCGIGWLVDGFRLPRLLDDCNKQNKEHTNLPLHHGDRDGHVTATVDVVQTATSGFNPPACYTQQLPPTQQQLYVYTMPTRQVAYPPTYLEHPPPYSQLDVAMSATGIGKRCESKDEIV